MKQIFTLTKIVNIWFNLECFTLLFRLNTADFIQKKELADLYEVCKEYKIPLYVDGARLGYGVSSNECDIKLCNLKDLCDIFYIGGTKVGAFCGEAVVFTYKNAPFRCCGRFRHPSQVFIDKI